MNLKFTPALDDLMNIECDTDFAEVLKRADRMMDNNDVEGACELRLRCAIELLEAIESLDEDQEIELDMSNRDNHPAVELLAASAFDHYQICDFEMTAALLESALLFDSEDNFSLINTLGYCYVALEDFEALEDIKPLLNFGRVASEFFDGFTSFMKGRKVKFSDRLKSELSTPTSELRTQVNPLFMHFSALEELIK